MVEGLRFFLARGGGLGMRLVPNKKALDIPTAWFRV